MAEDVRKKLASYQQETQSICQEYDQILQKRSNQRADYGQSEQFNLIKKAISMMPRLEDLIDIQVSYLETCAKEHSELSMKYQHESTQNKVSTSSSPSNTIHSNYEKRSA